MSTIKAKEHVDGNADELIKTAVKRYSSPAIIALLISWCAWNWKAILFLAFGKFDIVRKIEILQSEYFNIFSCYLLPILSTCLVIFTGPWVLLGISKINSFSEIKLQKHEVTRKGNAKFTAEALASNTDITELVKLYLTRVNISHKANIQSKDLLNTNTDFINKINSFTEEIRLESEKLTVKELNSPFVEIVSLNELEKYLHNSMESVKTKKVTEMHIKSIHNDFESLIKLIHNYSSQNAKVSNHLSTYNQSLENLQKLTLTKENISALLLSFLNEISTPLDKYKMNEKLFFIKEKTEKS